jgi:hypothetical protein
MAGNLSSGFHITGYVFAFSGSLCKIENTEQNKTLQPEEITLTGGVKTIPAPSDRPLFADVTISSTSSDSMTGYKAGAAYNFTDVQGGFYKPHITAHLRGRIPEGGHIGFKDGHGAWRKFKDMDQRAKEGVGFW